MQPGYKHVIKGKGMPVSRSSLLELPHENGVHSCYLQISKQLGARGDLVIEFSVIFPASLDETQKQKIAAAL